MSETPIPETEISRAFIKVLVVASVVSVLMLTAALGCYRHRADYDTLPLDAFEPALRTVFATPRKSIYLGDSALGG